MRISEVLTSIRGFTDYAESLGGDVAAHGRQATTCWVFILGTFGPTPVLRVKDGPYFCPLQAIAVGWDACHDAANWTRLPDDEQLQQLLELSPENHAKLAKAIRCQRDCNMRLRADVVAACGLEEDQNAPFFDHRKRQNAAGRIS